VAAGFATPEISVTINGDRHLSDLTLDELLALPNTKAEAITKIFIGALRYGDESLSIGIYIYASSYEVNVSGGEKDALYVFEQLKDLSRDLEVWYGKLRRDGFWLSAGCASLVVTFASASVLTLLLGLRVAGTTAVSAKLLNAATFISLVLTAAMALVWLAEWVVKRLYPKAEILIGDGLKRSEALADMRRNLFWVVIAGIAVALATAVLTHLVGLS
jgi:hypothetical protein